MKFVTIRELRNRPGRIWEELGAEELVLTANGKPVGILVGLDGGDLEEALASLRRARALAAVSRMRRRAAETGASKLGSREIAAEIRAARSARRRRSP